MNKNVFVFNGKFYSQIEEGTEMGYPLSYIFVLNIFINNFEPQKMSQIFCATYDVAFKSPTSGTDDENINTDFISSVVIVNHR